MRKHNITIVHIAAYYPPHVGGLENVVKSITDAQAARGDKVIVLTSNQGVPTGTYVDKSGAPKIQALTSFEFAHTPVAPTLPWHLFRLPKQSLVHLHLSQVFFPELTMLVARLRRIPYIVHFHLDVGASGRLGALFLLYKKLTWGPILRNAHHVIVCGKDQIDVVSNRYKVAADKITLIENAVDESFFSNRVYTAPTGTLRLLYVGRLSTQKRVERLIHAMSHLVGVATLTIVGDGHERQKLEELVATLGLTNVAFVGAKNATEIQQYHAQSDALVISSDHEGMSLVILEAMAAGLPVIGTCVSGIEEQLQGVGVLVEEPYAESFASAITTLSVSREKLTKLSNQSRTRASTQRFSTVMEKLDRVYENVRI